MSFVIERKTSLNIKKEQKKIRMLINAALFDIGKLVHETAVSYAPISPTQRQKNAQRKTKRRRKRTRKPHVPGNLEKSIDYRFDKKNEVSFFVDSSSPAGKYAEFIHDGNYELGVNSKKKGGKVGPKFIERAIDDNKKKILRIINKYIRREFN